MRPSDGNRTQWGPAKRAMHRAVRTLVPSAALSLVMALCCVAAAVAEEHAAAIGPRGVVSANGRAIFDSLVAAIVAHAGLKTALTVTHADSVVALRDFCENVAGTGPDVVLVIHRLEPELAAECATNGIDDIAEVELGRSALILAVRSGSMLTGLTSRQVYMAVAREVPYRDEFMRNTAVRWSDVDPSLPAQDIRFQLPMRNEGSRAIFDSLLLEGGCRNENVVKQIFDARQRTARCVTARSDRVREIVPDQAMRALMEAPVGTVGVVTQVDVARSGGLLVGLALDDVAPSQDAILRGIYDYSTSFWLYAKRGQAKQGGSEAVDADIEHIIEQSQSEAVIGPDGPLQGLGLIPLPADERAAQRETLAAGNGGFSLASMTGWVTSFASEAWRMFGIRPTLPPEESRGATNFTSLMDIAGYRVTEVNSSIGIIPDAGMIFSIAREMSDSDMAYLERSLYRDSLRRPGAISAVQRKIIRSIIGIRQVGSFEVAKVEIVFLPLPKVSLTVSPKDVLRADRGSGNSQ